MKNLITLLLIVLINITVTAQTEKTIESKIQKVTVYQEGAEITRQANIELQKGKTVLLFKGLSSKLDSRSIQAKGNSDLMIISISHNIDYINKVKISAEIEQLEKRKIEIKDSLSMIDGFIKVYQQEKEMIIANKNIGGNNGVNIADLKNTATFFRTRLMDIENNTNQLQKQQYNLKLDFIEVAKQLLELNSKSDLPTSVIKVVVSIKTAKSYSFNLSYIIGEAGWEPNYDLRISDVNHPMDLFYKAKVYQNTDKDWKNVKLILSTGNPNISNYKPELSTYYLTFNNYYRNQNKAYKPKIEPFKGIVYGKVTDSDGVPLPGVSIIIKGTTQGTITNIDGEYEIKMPFDKNALVFSYIGCEERELYVNSGLMNVSLSPSLLELEEVVVVGYSGRASRAYTPKKKEQIPLSIEKRQTSTEFEIEIPYSIPSDNQPYDVTMVKYEIPADYIYSVVPKISDDVFLIAKIPDWTKYEMISGNVNLFFQGIYQGITYFDLKVFQDTLSVSIGIDKNIVISREILKDFSKKSTVGAYIKELKSWEITIKNNKNISVDLLVEDQFPISKVSDIKVELIESSNAQLNEDDGKLTWNLKIEPKEKKTLIVKYEVKYPKNKKLIIE